jgi:outer membrane protein, protease secretion system
MRLSFNRYIIGLIFCCLSRVGNAFDLIQAYDHALANDPEFKAAIAEYESGLAFEGIGRSAILPKLNASYYTASNSATQWGRAYSGGPQQAMSWTYPSNYYGAFLNQPLFSLEAIARWKQGSAQANVAKTKFIYDSQALLIRVMQVYMDVLLARKRLGFQIAEERAFMERWKQNQRMQQKGFSSITDVLEAESAYQLSEANTVEARNNLDIAVQKLTNITKAEKLANEDFKDIDRKLKLIKLDPKTFEEWSDKALESNMELATATNRVEVAKQEYKKNNAAHYPTVSVVGGITSQQSNTVVSIQNTTNQNYIGIQVNLPLFTGGEITSRSSQSYSSFQKSQAERDMTRDKILTELRREYDQVVRSEKKISALDRAVDSATTLVKASNMGVNKGEKISLDVLYADRARYKAEVDLAASQYQYLLALMRLKHLAGTLVVEDFNKMAASFKNTHILKTE